ncbi:hypothetical protein PIB30_117955 [Stylosanthes scabra]|uniref:Uncharacterized protein n=1 Tax=Stylosanthes scabra TaxID=79078 RepID=A0ABU6Q6E9_9FABA|nr:hypothetical protein [Stylosanthes scabra]
MASRVSEASKRYYDWFLASLHYIRDEHMLRMWGRALRVLFVLPYSYFLRNGYITVKLGVRLCGLFALGAGQGFIGWWMVKSGLEEPPSGYVQPRESPYCLAAHLTSAFSISLLVGLTAISGAFVDGNDAGHAFNTFLKMSNTWISDDIFEMTPLIRNFFENTSTVQFDHRILATASLVSVGILWLSTRKLEIHPAVRALIGGTLGMASLQVIISIFSFIPSLTFIICGSFLFSVYLLIAPCLEYSSFSPNILNQLRLITIDK